MRSSEDQLSEVLQDAETEAEWVGERGGGGSLRAMGWCLLLLVHTSVVLVSTTRHRPHQQWRDGVCLGGRGI